MRKPLLLITGFLASIGAFAQLSGSYTVGGSSPDYSTIQEAVTDLNTNGVNGPVTFNIREGLYEEGVIIIDSIVGVSATNTVTFTSENPSAPAEITNSNGDVFRLDKSGFMHFENLKLNCGGVYTAAVNLYGNVHGLHFKNNIVSLGYNSYGVFMDNPPTNDGPGIEDTMIVSGNEFYGGSWQLYVYNGNNKLFEAIVVSDNVFEEFNGAAMYLSRMGRVYSDFTFNNYVRQGGAFVFNNKIRTTSETNTFGIWVEHVEGSVEVHDNVVSLTGGNVRGLWQSNNNIPGSPTIHHWYNNLVYVSGSNANYGMYLQNGSMQEYAHNTIIVDPAEGATKSYANYISNYGEAETFYNNVFVNTGTDTTDLVYYFRSSATPSDIVSAAENNVYYTGGKYFSTVAGTFQETLADYETAVGYEGVNYEESTGGFFFENGEAKACSVPSYTGSPISYVTTDINGVSRSGTAPVVGAIETTTTSMPTLSLSASVNGGCAPMNSVLGIDNDMLYSGRYTWTSNGDTISNSMKFESDFMDNQDFELNWTVPGCEFNESLSITVKQPSSSNITEVACDSYAAPDGQVFTASGSYSVVIPNAVGCDSTINIELTIKNSTSSTITASECVSYEAPDGSVFTSSGIYEVVIPNAKGCDSTITIDLTILEPTFSEISETVCDMYTAPDGKEYTSSGQYTAVIANAVGCDSTITINLTVNKSTSSELVEKLCADSYIAPDGQELFDNGVYTIVIPNDAGCDSVITLDLTLDYMSVSVTQDGNVLTAEADGATFQWFNADDETPIQDATDNIFTAVADGNYAVIATNGSCTATSEVLVVGEPTGVFGNVAAGIVKAYPNPTDQTVRVELAKTYQNVQVRLTDITGNLIDTEYFGNTDQFELNIDSPDGVYFVNITTGEGDSFVFKAVKN